MTLIETKARIGVFAIALEAYLPQFPTLVPEFKSQYEDFKKRIPDTVEVIDGGIVTNKELSMIAGDKFRAADVDLVILQLLTYATSYNMLPAVRDLNVPVVLVNLQKKKAPDYENTDTATWLGELYACGAVGEMVADLERAGKRHAVITGVVEGGDEVAQKEIEDWCKAAQVRRRFRDTNLAQIGRPYPGMMDLYIDETNLYHKMWLYTKQFDWEKMWAIADDINDTTLIQAKAEDILNTFDIEGGATVETVWEMAKYVVAFEQWVKDEKIAFIASHYDGFAQGVAGKLDAMLIPAFSMLIKQGTACAVEGDIKVAMAMSILKTISGTGQLSEMYSIDFEKDICIIGHSGSGDADISLAKKPTMKIVPVFHGKTGGGYLTQFYPPVGPVTYLGITQDANGNFKFVVAEGVNEEGPIFTFGDTNMRTKFTCGARDFCNRWSEAGPTHHMAAAIGRHTDTILKVAKIFNIPVDVITR
ncbi:MAG: arabinose isomerase [Erysipelotrichaceae bacterium]|nr:arabinose isomerase [Erysipelotrichaceae bacterium]